MEITSTLKHFTTFNYVWTIFPEGVNWNIIPHGSRFSNSQRICYQLVCFFKRIFIQYVFTGVSTNNMIVFSLSSLLYRYILLIRPEFYMRFLWPSDALIWRHGSGSTWLFLPDGTALLPAPILICHLWSSVSFTREQFQKRILMNLICNMCSNIVLIKSRSYLPGCYDWREIWRPADLCIPLSMFW